MYYYTNRMNRTIFLSFFNIILFSLSSCAAENIRQPAVAGRFYPGNATELSRMADHYISSAATVPVEGTPVAFIVPHAGYIFSGPVAGYVYTLLKNKDIKTVVIIGLSHRYPLKGASIITEGSFRTPLGLVPINEALCKKLMEESSLIEHIPEAHTMEHSIEVQLPFLQRIFKHFSIVPILIGNPSLSVCREIGQAIADTIRNKNIIILASTDMSHYPEYSEAVRVDQEAIKALKTMDPLTLQSKINLLMSKNIPNLSCVFCGEGAVYAAMYASKALGAQKATILKYANSGDTAAGNKDSVVGYLAAVFTTDKKEEPPMKEKKTQKETFSIKPENQKVLLQVARKSIVAFLKEKKLATVSARGDQELEQTAAVFVTLTKNGTLRGCIGTTEARYPLIDAINQLTVSAAFQDYRFPPVSADELDDIHIEISVLSPLKKIQSHKEIQPDVHGVVVKKNSRSGLFLPQVWEHFPGDKEAFMDELCSQKAGLPRDAWKKDKDVELSIFTVFKFEESEKE